MFYFKFSLTPKAARKSDQPNLPRSLPELLPLCKSLVTSLPHSVILPHDDAAFTKSTTSYWAQQACEVPPACVVRPQDTQQLSTAIRILKAAYGDHAEDIKAEGLFAIRSGGHSPVPRASSIRSGVLLDLGHFDEVTVSEDRSSVVIGAGAKWGRVSTVLDGIGLAAVGGRNSAVGVGGLTLGGKLSPRGLRYSLRSAPCCHGAFSSLVDASLLRHASKLTSSLNQVVSPSSLHNLA